MASRLDLAMREAEQSRGGGGRACIQHSQDSRLTRMSSCGVGGGSELEGA